MSLATLPFGMMIALIPCLLIAFLPRTAALVVFGLTAVIGCLFSYSALMPDPGCSGDGCIAYSIIDGTILWSTLLCLVTGTARWWLGRTNRREPE